MVNMKKLTSLILMAAVVLWNKKHNEQEAVANVKNLKNSIRVLKRNVKNINKNGIECEDSAYNITKEVVIQRLKARINKLKKLKRLSKKALHYTPICYNKDIEVRGTVQNLKTVGRYLIPTASRLDKSFGKVPTPSPLKS